MLQVKLFAMRFCDDMDGFDDEPLRAFMVDKDVVSLKEKFCICSIICLNQNLQNFKIYRIKTFALWHQCF